MRIFVLAKKHIHFALLFCIAFLVARSESNRNIYGGDPRPPTQQYQQPVDLDQYASDPREKSPPRSSAVSQNVPQRIGLEVNGRIKSLLWRNPRAFVDSTLTPLFSSLGELEYGEDNGHDDKDVVSRVDEGVEGIQNSSKKRGLASLILPGSIYGTADYRFRKERWYGVETIGMSVRWNRPTTWFRDSKRGGVGGQKNDLMVARKGSAWLPTTLDVSAQHSVFSPSRVGRNGVFTSLVDSGDVRIGWNHYDEGDLIRVGEANPWVQIGVDRPYTSTSDSESEQKNPLFLRFFLPLIRRRFDLQWTSRWETDSADYFAEKFAGDGSNPANEWSSKYRKADEDPWWIPQVSLDPSMGTLSSKNRYRSSFSRQDERQYLTEFKLRIRTTIPTLLSSVTNNMMTTSEDDDLQQTASVRLEYSFMTDPGERIHPSLGATCTTARFETIIVPSFWVHSMAETSKFGLIHEQFHTNKK